MPVINETIFAPPFEGGEWIQQGPINLKSLRDKAVVLVDFWDSPASTVSGRCRTWRDGIGDTRRMGCRWSGCTRQSLASRGTIRM